MRRTAALLLALVAVGLTVLPATAQDADTVRVFIITVDALHPDQVSAATAPVLNQWKATATWYEQHRAVMASETLPNHVAIGTGTYPERNGLPGNSGRAALGDTAEADPDLRDPGLRQATSLVATIESACPDLRTLTAFSKAYVHVTFAADPADANFNQPAFNIPVSDHALDTAVMSFLQPEVGSNPPDFLFANLGDTDRAGHIDLSGVAGLPGFQHASLHDTDKLLGVFQAQLQAQGLWDDAVIFLMSDHSMDWANPVDPSRTVSVLGALEADPRTTGRFFTSEEGGTALVYLLDPAATDADVVLKDAREIILGLGAGIAEALYREPNALDPGFALDDVHPDWHLAGTDRAGEIFVYTNAGYKAGTQSSNPVPGNHGHGVTRHATLMITGGWDGIAAQSIAPSDPDAVDVIDDTAALPEQSEQVDIAPTVGWLLGVPDPGLLDGGDAQWQGRVLTEAFTRQPAPLCDAVVAGPAPPPPSGPAPQPPAPEPAPPLPTTGGGLTLAAALALAGALALAATARRRPA